MANAHFLGGLPRLLQYNNPNQFITILNGGGLPNLLQYFIEGGGILGPPKVSTLFMPDPYENIAKGTTDPRVEFFLPK